MTHATVTSFEDFKKALLFADRISIAESFHLTEQVVIERPVAIDGGYHTLNCFHFGHSSTSDHAQIVVKSRDVQFRQMNLIAPNAPEGKHATAIMCDYGDGTTRVSNSVFIGFNWAAVWQFNAGLVVVDNCTIVGSGSTSYNYGIWQGGKSNVPEQVLRMTGCRVFTVRHAIGASYHPNSYYAIGNTISTLKHSFDRHNWNEGGSKGGLHTVISGNTFLDPDRLAFSLEKPYEGGSIVFTGNKLNHAADRHIGEIADEKVWEGVMPYGWVGVNQFNQ